MVHRTCGFKDQVFDTKVDACRFELTQALGDQSVTRLFGWSARTGLLGDHRY
jgi:hypothetical protein